MTNYAKASVHPSELREFQDSQTGAHIYQLTNDTSINHNLYFLTPSFTPDQGYLIFTSYRSEQPNFFKIEFPNGDIVQLTDADDIHGYSGVISKEGTELFYSQADAIKAIHLDTFEERVLAVFPGGGLGECSVSADEQFIVTAMKRDDKSHITVTATDGSGGEVIYTSPDQTIIHPQFHPKHPDLIAYSGDPAPRMWTIKRDGTENRSLYQHDNNVFLVHETFLGAQDELIVTHWPYSLRRMSLETLQTVTATDGSGGEVIYTSPDQTIIHPQFHPKHPDLIAYSGDPAPRMWTIKRDGTENRSLYQHDNNVFLVHETFLGAQDELIVTHWPYSLQRMSLETLQMQTIADFNAWHIASNRDGTKVLCDTVHPDIGLRLIDVESGEHAPICYPKSSSSGSQWKTDRYALAEDWAAAQQAGDREKALSWMEMKVDTVYGPQWTHPHPSFSPDETAVVYTSDASGHSQVYVAVIP